MWLVDKYTEPYNLSPKISVTQSFKELTFGNLRIVTSYKQWKQLTNFISVNMMQADFVGTNETTKIPPNVWLMWGIFLRRSNFAGASGV